jgi:Sec-independent protein secretion pathway component TatC
MPEIGRTDRYPLGLFGWLVHIVFRAFNLFMTGVTMVFWLMAAFILGMLVLFERPSSKNRSIDPRLVDLSRR